MKKLWMTALLLGLGAPALHAQVEIDPLLTADQILPHANIALSGGNPVPGASSTLGLRLRALPRLSFGGRFTAAKVEFDDVTSGDEFSSWAHSLNVDVAVGIFGGFSLLPTVGGFGSIDLVGSYGKLNLSDDDGFLDDPTSWAAGVRVGIMRESFTAPGIALTGMYRKIGDFEHSLGTGFTSVRLEDNRAWSVRGTIGKRLLMLGLTVGIGYDKFSADARQFENDIAIAGREVDETATTFFGNLSWTMLILNVVGEGGVQHANNESVPFGSLAVRIAL